VASAWTSSASTASFNMTVVCAHSVVAIPL
jgi:hypothetical protein